MDWIMVYIYMSAAWIERKYEVNVGDDVFLFSRHKVDDRAIPHWTESWLGHDCYHHDITVHDILTININCPPGQSFIITKCLHVQDFSCQFAQAIWRLHHNVFFRNP